MTTLKLTNMFKTLKSISATKKVTGIVKLVEEVDINSWKMKAQILKQAMDGPQLMLVMEMICMNKLQCGGTVQMNGAICKGATST